MRRDVVAKVIPCKIRLYIEKPVNSGKSKHVVIYIAFVNTIGGRTIKTPFPFKKYNELTSLLSSHACSMGF
jgi:hypothetical protein